MPTKYVVRIDYLFTWYLRGTVWTSEPARADRFDDRALARTALVRARRFTQPALYRAAEVVEDADVGVADEEGGR